MRTSTYDEGVLARTGGSKLRACARSASRPARRRSRSRSVPGSVAEAYVVKRFSHKTARRVGNGLHPTSFRGVLSALPHVFWRGQSKGVEATYHFTFVGRESARATVEIRDCTIRVGEGQKGKRDIHVRADSEIWLGFLAKERSLLWALLRGKIRLKGNPKHLLVFGRCFLRG